VYLLVSVANAADAAAALAGGAHVIDAKDPSAGALGAVSDADLRAIHAVVGGTRILSAALGDAPDATAVERAAGAAVAAGARYVKLGFAGVRDARHARDLLDAATSGAAAGGGARVIAAAYADAEQVGALDRHAVLEAAADAGVEGVLLDTARKDGPSLTTLLSERALALWVNAAHDAGLLVALAGKLTAADLAAMHALGADLVGVRGAACVGGRAGHVSAALVRELRARCPAPTPARRAAIALPA